MDAEVLVDEAFSGLMLTASIVGLHVCGRGETGAYIIRPWHFLPLVFLSFFCVASLVGLIYYFIATPVPYWFFILNLPMGFAYVYCIIAYAQTARNSRLMAKYMESLKLLTMKPTLQTQLMMLISLIYPLVLAVCSLLLVPEIDVFVAIPFVCITSFLPAFQDIYMGAFIVVICIGFDKLRRKVQTKASWATADVQDVYNQWLQLSHALDMHNQVFSLTCYLRVLLQTVEGLTCVFTILALDSYRGDCEVMLVLTIIPTLEIISRFLTMCLVGQALATADEDLIKAVMGAVYQVPGRSVQREALTALAARLEAQPSRVLIWGMGSVTGQTFLRVCGLVVTYLVVVLQLSPKEDWAWATSDTLTRYDHCFDCNTTSY